MRLFSLSRWARHPHSSGLLARWRKDRRGTTAVEFAMVAAPFFLLILGIMTVGLHFFTIQSLENGVAVAARKIRTGEAQKEGKTLADFRQMVCNAAGSYIKCGSKLVVHVKSGAAFADLDPPTPCVTNGTLTASAGQGTDPLASASGTQSAAVLVTACYEWELGNTMWQGLWNLITVGPGTAAGTQPKVAGKTIIQATTTFRTEPYQ
jgi:Flp pilus assembly protein TadG